MTFVGYALGYFITTGGVIWVPFYAACVGLAAGFWAAYAEWGLVVAWLVTYTALLGYHAEHAVFGLARRGFVYRLAYFLRVDGLTVLAVEAVAVGTVAFMLGAVARRGSDRFQTG